MLYLAKAWNIFQNEGLFELVKKSTMYFLYNSWYRYVIEYIRPLKYRLFGYSVPPNPNKIIYINPEKVEYVITGEVYKYGARKNYGKIKPGVWDTQRKPVEQSEKYQACKMRIENNIPWEKTGIIESYTEWVDNDFDGIDGCYSRQDLVELYDTQRESLYQSIKQNGFDETKSKVCCDIHIDRNGDFIYARKGGHHRFSICRILNIDKVPVKVIFRHEEWQKTREKVYEEKPEQMRDTELGNHPDLQDILN